MSTANWCIRRGSSLIMQTVVSQDGVVQDISDWNIRAQVFQNNTVVQELDVSLIDPVNGVWRGQWLDTSAWPVGTLSFNIRYELPTGEVFYTPDAYLKVEALVPYA